MANYQQGTRWSPDVLTDQATYDAAAKGGSGAGGTTTVISGAAPDGSDVWEYTTLGASAQRHVTVSGLSLVVNTAVGLWVNLPSYANLKKIFIFLGQGGFVNYFRTTITANDLEGSNGWVFIQRPKSQFATTGTPDWANPITDIRIGVTAEIGASGGETMQIGPLYTHLNTRPKCIIFLDDSNDTDYTEAFAYLEPLGYKAVVGVYEAKIDTTNFLTTANLLELDSSGWDMAGHELTELDTLNLADKTTAMQGIKSYLDGLGLTKASDLFVLPGGKFDTETIQAAQAAGITALRTTVQFSYSPAIQPHVWDFHAKSTAVNQIETSTDWLALLDDAIANNSTFATFSHGLFAAATDTHTNLAEWKAYIDGLKVRVDSGLVDVVTWSEYIYGLERDDWINPVGTSFLRGD